MAEVNKAIPEVDLTINGQAYKAVFDMNAYCLIEEKTGKNAFDKETWTNVNTSQATIIIWAALLRHHPDISLETLRAMLSLSDLAMLMLHLNVALDKSAAPASGAEKKTEVNENQNNQAS